MAGSPSVVLDHISDQRVSYFDFEGIFDVSTAFFILNDSLLCIFRRMLV
jgi:hypothetical protein